MHLKKITDKIKYKAEELGFLQCGIAKAEYLHNEYRHLKNFLKKKWHANMHYMENYFEKRLDPTKLIENAKSVIVLSYNYYTKQNLPNLKISKYAYGADYHHVIKHKLKQLYSYIENQLPGVAGKSFVDSAPILEKAWAVKAGLGWIGKNTLLISKQKGSFFFLSSIIINKELEYNIIEQKNLCGTCTKCIDACPTKAIVQPGKLDSRKCISYLTIENKNNTIPKEFKNKYKDWIFGCDICQDVCPWNRFSIEHNEKAFNINEEILNLSANNWINLTEDNFKNIFKKSAVKRAKFHGLKRNIKFISK